MNKKKVLALLASLTLVVTVGVGATLAYFTDNQTATNVITMDHVDISLDEPSFPEDKKIEDITPGQEIAKDPTITLGEDSADAYVRAKITFEGLTEKQINDLLNGNINIKDGWYLGEDGYYYYKDKVTEENSIVVLFDTVTIPTTWGNEVADLTFHINVTAEAIQADNFTPEYNEEKTMITGWNGITSEDIETYSLPSETEVKE